ncbi:MAG TPA: class I SAM-dependent methyltransferase family protein [Streptosporangiaceae bacterium]
MSGRDWLEWHDYYDEPGSPMHRRLLAVQEQVGRALDRCAPGPVRLVSMCAGQGRDLLPVLAVHPRRDDTTARLVELDGRNARVAADMAREAGLDGVEVVVGDASATDVYAGAVPAEIVMVCGVFGNITDDDIERTISFLPQLCAGGATVIWTRHREEPDVTPSICRWFAEYGFEQLAIVPPPGPADFGLGTHRYLGTAEPLRRGEQLFDFVGRRALRSRQAGQSERPV